MWDILIFWNCITCHSMYNILFQYTGEAYWCSETVSHVTRCIISCFNIHVRYTDVLKLYHMPLHVNILFQYTCEIYWCSDTYHMSLHVQYCVSLCMWDILMFWNCISCHSIYNILFHYTCETYWCSETVSHITPYTTLF